MRWGFLGAGFVATKAMAPAVHAAAGSVLQAVAARDAARAAALRPVTVSRDYAAVLDDPAVDVVYISLTNEQHLPWTLRALAAGKHVLCEKPLGLTGTEVAQMTEAAAASQRLLVEAGWYRWHPRTQRAEQLVRSGALGRLSTVEATFRFGGVPEGNYRLDSARGGGAWLDVGWYVSNALAWALPGDHPVSVQANPRWAPGGVDASVDATVALESGCLAGLSAGIDHPEHQVLVVAGEGGTVRLPRPDAFTSWNRASSLRWTDADGAHVEEFAPVDPYRLMVESVGQRVRGQPDAWVLEPAESLWTARLMDQVRASMG